MKVFNNSKDKIVNSIREYAENKAGDGADVKEVIEDITEAVSSGINAALSEFDGYEI